MKKKIKSLTVRQQIQQCPTLTPEERSLALFGLNKAKALKNVDYDKEQNHDLLYFFLWEQVPVIKGQSYDASCNFWRGVYRKLSSWQEETC